MIRASMAGPRIEVHVFPPKRDDLSGTSVEYVAIANKRGHFRGMRGQHRMPGLVEKMIRWARAR
jgi:hypothetical protein